MNSPKQVGFFTMKSFSGPGKPEASLSELGSRKTKEKTLLLPFLVFFAFLIKTLNDHLFRTVTGVQRRKLTSKDQKINDDNSRTKFGHDNIQDFKK